MVDVARSARRLLERLVTAAPKAGPVDPGLPQALDGNSAIAAVEALVSDAVALAASYPAADAVRRAAEAGSVRNAFGRPVSILESTGARAALATAVGYAQSGGRSVTFTAGTDLLRNLDLLRQAAGGDTPLVVHLAHRAPGAAGEAAGSGHEALYAAAETGAVVLAAVDVQDAVDLAVAGRRLAETALVPVVVAQDGEETACSVQDVRLPGGGILEAYLGAADQVIHTEGSSERMLFGEHRRRVPVRHDPDRPYLTGAKTDPWTHTLAEGGRALYREPQRMNALTEAFAEWGQLTGRTPEPLTSYRTDDARIVFLAAGAAFEPLRATVDALRARKIKAGVIGIRVLHPFPGAALVARLKGKQVAAILERVNPPHGQDPWLLSRVRESLFRSLTPGRGETPAGSSAPALTPRDLPRLVSVRYGLGGLPLEGADLLALGEELTRDPRSPLFLGVRFDPTRSRYPKRQVLLDELRRTHPDAASAGVRGARAPRLLPGTATCIRVVRRAGGAGNRLVIEAAALLHRLTGVHVRTLRAPRWERFERVVSELLVLGKDPVAFPGADHEADVTVWLAGDVPSLPLPEGALPSGGLLLLERTPGRGPFWEGISPALRGEIRRCGLKVYAVERGESEGSLREERLLGAVVAVLLAEHRLEAKPRKLLEERRTQLEGFPDAEIEARLGAFQAGFDRVLAVEAAAPEKGAVEITPLDPKTPEVVRRRRRTDEAMDSLSRFWDQVGILHARGEDRDLAPDPYLAAGVMPPLSSAFADLASARERIPVFDPARCTGCGECWSACPDEAMSPVVLSPSALLEAGLALAKEDGHSADALRPVLGKIGTRLAEAAAGDPEGGGRLGKWLEPACEQVLARTPGSEERKAALRDAAEHLTRNLADLPAARTAPFFERPQAETPGSGEILSLAINSEACKACGVCVAVCEPSALTRVVQDPDRLREARDTWNLVERLPATPPATLERARADADVGPVAAALLSREARVAFVGGDRAEPGSGEKIALRQVLALTTIHFQKNLNEYVQSLEELESELSGEIQRLLAQALPTSDLEALSRGLQGMDRSHVQLGELTGRVEEVLDAGRVEVPRLRRLVDVTRRVADLRIRVAKGEGELGRAPYSLVVGPGSAGAWMAAFPNNPFAVPVTVDATGEILGLARGVLEGRMAAAAREAALLRTARRELDAPREAAVGPPAGLTWGDLTDEERRSVPPLFAVMNEGADLEMGALRSLLSSGLPIKVLLLSDVNFGLDVGAGPLGPETRAGIGALDLEFLSLGLTGAVIAQCSLAHPEHLDLCVSEALSSQDPALVRLHVPSPVRHGFLEDRAVERARAAVDARAFPLLRFRLEGNAFVPSLEGNPEPNRTWVETGEGIELTPAHWALGEGRFASQFRSPVEGEETMDVAEWLRLDPAAHEGTVATLEGPDGSTFVVSPDLLRRIQDLERLWTLLGRLAGTLPAERASVPEEMDTARLGQINEEVLAQVRGEYEAKMQNLGSQIKLEMAYRVRERLLQLLARRGGNGTPGGGA